MVAFADLFSLQTRTAIKTRLLAIATAAGLPITSWIPGDPSERWTEIIPRAIDEFLSNFTTQAVRAFFFDLNTDPGDAGDLSADQTPRPGFLSAFGAGWWGVERGGATYASTTITLTNTGPSPATFKPYDLTFERSSAGADGGHPTYRNSEDPAIYVGLGGTLTLAPGAFATIPVVCEQIGSQGTAAPGEISVVVTGSFGTFTATNPTAAIGEDREDRTVYITRSRQQSAAASPAGPSDAYRYAATTGADGKPLQLWDGSGATTVNRVYVSEDDSTGHVLAYLANPSGPASSVEVSSANGNINGIAILSASGVVHNKNPIGVRPGTASIGPTIADSKTLAPGPAAAIATTIGPIAGTAKVKLGPGESGADIIANAQAAIALQLAEFFASPETAPVGGVDQTAGTGFMYRSDIFDVVKHAYPVPVAGQLTVPRLYAVSPSFPSSTSTTIVIGHVPVLRGNPTISAIADNGSGLVRLTLSSVTNLDVSRPVQIYAVEGLTGGSGDWLSGIWTVAAIDTLNKTVDLVGSVFPSGGTFTSALLSTIAISVVP